MKATATPVRTATTTAAEELYFELRAEARASILEALTKDLPED